MNIIVSLEDLLLIAKDERSKRHEKLVSNFRKGLINVMQFKTFQLTI